jgi:hypothetical protein
LQTKEGEAFARAVIGAEAREAFTAFFEKRKPASIAWRLHDKAGGRWRPNLARRRP